MATEDFGNAPVNSLNYTEWPNITPLLDHNGRVYHWWCNGNEQFFFRGNTLALNDALNRFAAARADEHEVLLRPGVGSTPTFNKDVTVPFDWSVQLRGGVTRQDTTLDRASKIWSNWPTMTVYVAHVDLSKVQIPAGVVVVELPQLTARGREALSSTDNTVRGWGACDLAALDPYDTQSMTAIAKLLDDPDDWVRSNVLHALATFGNKATPALPALRKLLITAEKKTKQDLQETIDQITNAKDTTAQERDYRAALKSIADFHKSLAHP
jgi:hypothetical protein